MKILKIISLLAIPTLTLITIPFVLNNKRNSIQYNENIGFVGFDKLQKQINNIKKELEELKQQGKEHCKKFHDLKETLIKLQEQLKYNEKKGDEYSKKIDKLEDKISNSTIATCSTVGGGVALATIPNLIKNKKKK